MNCRRYRAGVIRPVPVPSPSVPRGDSTSVTAPASPGRPRRRAGGSVLIIVLWIAFGLVALAVYFSHSMLFEFRAAEENAAGLAAEEAIEGAVAYLSLMLTNQTQTSATSGSTALTFAQVGILPALMASADQRLFEAVPVGDAAFWLLGREDTDTTREVPIFGLVDEASKLNLNTATREMLELLPRMTTELAAAILDWRDTDTTPTDNGAEEETYARYRSPYLAKNAPFESVEELSLVNGATTEILYGEDANLNGLLDPNENDSNLTPPYDNRDGRLDPGLFEYLTVWSREPNTGTNSAGLARMNVSSTNRTTLRTRLEELFGQQRANQIQSRLNAYPSFGSLVEFYLRSSMTLDEFGKISDELSVTNAAYTEGRVNVNTASVTVLACLPGIGWDKANQLVAYRRSNPANLTSVAWVTQVLDQAAAIQAGPYLTGHSFQYAADVVALGAHGRGYRRTLLVLDTSAGAARLLYRRDRGRLGWALGTYDPLPAMERNQTRLAQRRMRQRFGRRAGENGQRSSPETGGGWHARRCRVGVRAVDGSV